MWGIGKVTVVKVLSSGKQLRKLGDLHIQMVDVMSECTLFVAACCGSLGSTDMTSLRYTVWLFKMSNPKLNSAPDLKALPPKTEDFKEHVYRAHLQTAVWKAALDADPPSINPVHYGWSLESYDTYHQMFHQLLMKC